MCIFMFDRLSNKVLIMSIKNAKDLGKFLGNFFIYLFQQGLNRDRLIKRLK